MAPFLAARSSYVSYLRVGTQRQGQSGLGIDAQRAAVDGYVKSIGGTLLEEHIKVKSGPRGGKIPRSAPRHKRSEARRTA